MDKLYKIRDKETGLFYSGSLYTGHIFGPKGKFFKRLKGCREEIEYIRKETEKREIPINPDTLEIIEFSIKEEGIVT